jgi:hypothetical protein
VIARKNLGAGRGDRRGAARLFVFTTALWLAAWIVGARHYREFNIQDNRFFEFLRFAMFNAGILWLLYIALEPYVRRFSPRILISWTRALSGQIVDPRVGRDLLIGVAVGTAMAVLGYTSMIVPVLLGDPPPTPRGTNLQFLLGAPAAISTILRMVTNALQTATAIAVPFAVGRALLRNSLGGGVLAAGVLSVFVFGQSSWDRPFLTIFVVVAFVGPMVLTMIYGGLLAASAAFLVNQALNSAPLTLDPSRPYATGAMWSLLLVLGLAVFGFYASRKGQPLFGRLVQAD